MVQSFLHQAIQDGNLNPVEKLIKEKYSDMLNMKALVGIRIIFLGKEFEL